MAMSAGAGGKVEEPSASGALGVSDSEERIAVLPPRLLQEGPGKLTPVAVLTGHTDRVWHVSFHPKHELLASCSGDKTVRLWEPEPSSTPKAAGVEPRWRCVEVLEGVATRTIRVCEWSPDGRFLATCSFDGAVRVWEVNIVTGGRVKSELVATLEGHENEVKGVAWSADGTLLASCGRDKSVWIWDATEVDEGGEYECVEVLHGHSQDVKCVTFHPSRSLLVSCGYDDSVKVWEEVEEDWVCSSTLTGHTSTVWQTAFEPSEGNRLVSCSDDLGLRVWHWFDGAGKDGGGTFKCTAVLPKVHSRTIFSVDWSPTTNAIASGGADDAVVVTIQSAATRDEDPTFVQDAKALHAHEGDVNCVRWHPRRAGVLITAGDDAAVRLWKYTAGDAMSAGI